jgi:phage/conjugal plasmid C-4 type zinc finger TraR family protein
VDEIDLTPPHEERFQAEALAIQQSHREPDDNPGDDCLDCGNEIPLERRLAKPGCRRCISCQEAHEIHLHWRAL